MPETTLHVKKDGIFNDLGFVARPDRFDKRRAAAFARRMAAYHAGTRVDAAHRSPDGFVDLYKLLGIPDAGDFDAEKLWATNRAGPPWADGQTTYRFGNDWMRIPIGTNLATGETVWLDMKEPQEFGGQGHMAVIVGAPGSGKTIILSAIIDAFALTHSPEDLVIAAFDLKGSALITNVRGLPHIVAAHSNLADDTLWIPRLYDVIEGELENRQTALDNANVTEFGEYQFLRRHGGEDLPPIPYLLVIIDEFTELFLLSDDAKMIIDKIGRQGRSLGVRLILGSQRLGSEMGKIMSTVPIRICLRTLEDSGDSYTLLGNYEAEHLPVNPPGAGIIKTCRGLKQFQAAFPLQNYVPVPKVEAEQVRAAPGYMAPVEFKAVGMPPPPVLEHVPEPKEPEPVFRPDGRRMKQIEATIARMAELELEPPKRMWLPPLAKLPVDELVRRYRGKPWDVDYGKAPDLCGEIRFPVALKDEPRKHRQRVYAPKVSGNCAVVGCGESGKTWAVTTMICGAALMYPPERVQFFVSAFSGAELNRVARLPHVSGFAVESDPLRTERMIADLLELIETREREFPKCGLTTMDTLRERKFGSVPGDVPDDPFGDVFYVIDGWTTFIDSFARLLPHVERLLLKGPGFGVHVIICASGWLANDFHSRMRGRFSANVELRLQKNHDFYNVNNEQVAKSVPFGEIDLHRETGDGQGGESAETVTEKIRGRLTTIDGYHGQAGLPWMSNGDDVAAALAAVVAPPATQVQVLPARVGIDEVLAQWEPVPGLIPFGISDAGLVPAVADFDGHPHLILAGRRECGLSASLSTVAQSIMAYRDPSQAQIYVFDPHHGMLCVVEEGPYLGRYAHGQQQIRDTCAAIAAVLAGRMPAAELDQRQLATAVRDWEGPEIYVIVDREETLLSWGASNFKDGHPLSELIPYIERGRQVGFHLIIGRNIADWPKTPGNPVVSEMRKAKTPIVIMDGDPDLGVIIGTTKAARADPGRGIYVRDRYITSVQIALPQQPLKEHP